MSRTTPAVRRSPLAARHATQSLTRRERLRLGLVTQFLRDLFSLEVNEREEYRHKITQALVTDLVSKC